jgi:hypothetical protein
MAVAGVMIHAPKQAPARRLAADQRADSCSISRAEALPKVVDVVECAGGSEKGVCHTPVPGGVSTTRTSRRPHTTPKRSCSNALPSMGPLHARALPASTSEPMDMHDTPWFCSGMILEEPSIETCGLIPATFMRCGIEGPDTSASSKPTRRPHCPASATARFTAPRCVSKSL